MRICGIVGSIRSGMGWSSGRLIGHIRRFTGILRGGWWRGVGESVSRGVGARPDLHAAFEEFADQALIGDAALGGFGFQSRQKGFGQAHVDPRGLGRGFPGEGAELRGVEGGKVLGEEGIGLGGRVGFYPTDLALSGGVKPHPTARWISAIWRIIWRYCWRRNCPMMGWSFRGEFVEIGEWCAEAHPTARC